MNTPRRCLAVGLNLARRLTRFAENFQQDESLKPVMRFFQNENPLLVRLDNVLSIPMSRLSRISFVYKCYFLLYIILFLMTAGIVSRAILFPKSLDKYALDNSQIAMSGFDEQPSPNPYETIILPLAPDSQFTLTKRIEFGEDYQKITCIATGDINGDRYPDIVIGTDMGEPNAIYLNQNGQSFQFWKEIGSKRSRGKSIVLVDVDLDRDTDILIGDQLRANQVYINESNSFSLSERFGSPDSMTIFIEAGDLDGDRYPDLVETNEHLPTALYYNNGEG